MTSTGADDPGGVGAFGDRRVVVGVEHDTTRSRLLSWLDTESDVRELETAPSTAADTDVYVLDRPTLERYRDDLAAVQSSATPAQVPVLLVATADETGDLDYPDLGGSAADVVTDVVDSPLRPAAVRYRLRSMLRIRALSVEAATRQLDYHDLLDLLHEGVCLVDDGRVTYMNGPGRRLFGVTSEDAIGRPLTDFVSDDDAAAVTALVEDVLSSGAAPSFRSVAGVTDAGETVPLSMGGASITSDGTEYVQVVFRDRRAEREGVDQLELYMQAMDAAAQGITIADVTRPDEPLIYANEAFCRLTGYEAAEVIGRNCRFLQGEATDPDAVARMRAAIDAREPVTVQVRNYRKDGTPFWNQVNLIPVANDDGTVTHYLGFQSDVTERVRREQQLERYRTLVQAAGDPIYTLDARGRFTDVNDALLSFTGYSREEVLGTPAAAVIDDQDVATCEGLILDLLYSEDSTGSRTAEIVVETVDGDRRLCEVSIGLLPAGDGFRGTVGILRDITEPKGREQRLAVLERVLRHNLKNKMNVILGRVDELQGFDLDETTREQVDVVESAAQSLLDISDSVREFRDVVRLQENEPMTSDLTDVVADVAAAKRQAFPAATVAVDAPERAMVRSRGRLDVAIDELVQNAIEHSDREDPTISIRVRHDDGRVRLEVADDGPGIPVMERNVIETDAERPLEHGSGLGLWLVTWTVEQSGGEIDIVDRDPRGTVVRLSLPRGRSD